MSIPHSVSADILRICVGPALQFRISEDSRYTPDFFGRSSNINSRPLSSNQSYLHHPIHWSPLYLSPYLNFCLQILSPQTSNLSRLFQSPVTPLFCSSSFFSKKTMHSVVCVVVTSILVFITIFDPDVKMSRLSPSISCEIIQICIHTKISPVVEAGYIVIWDSVSISPTPLHVMTCSDCKFCPDCLWRHVEYDNVIPPVVLPRGNDVRDYHDISHMSSLIKGYVSQYVSSSRYYRICLLLSLLWTVIISIPPRWWHYLFDSIRFRNHILSPFIKIISFLSS